MSRAQKRLAYLRELQALKTAAIVAVAALMMVGMSAQPVRADPPMVPVTGQVVSASVRTSMSNNVVFTTPPSGSFLLTQACVSRIAGQTAPITLSCDGFGTVAIFNSTSPQCVSFTPGYALPQGKAIRCDFLCASPPCVESVSDAISCSISAVENFSLQAPF